MTPGQPGAAWPHGPPQPEERPGGGDRCWWRRCGRMGALQNCCCASMDEPDGFHCFGRPQPMVRSWVFRPCSSLLPRRRWAPQSQKLRQEAEQVGPRTLEPERTPERWRPGKEAQWKAEHLLEPSLFPSRPRQEAASGPLGRRPGRCRRELGSQGTNCSVASHVGPPPTPPPHGTPSPLGAHGQPARR